MATLADAFVRIRPDTTRTGAEIRQGTEAAAGDAGERAGRSFGRRMVTAIGIAIAGATAIGAVLVSAADKAVDSARDLAETQSKVGVVFGASADQVRAFAASAETALGQSKQTALDGAAAFAIYGKAAGLAGNNLVKFSTDLTELASDVGSFSNHDPAQVIADFGAAMRGEFDPIEKYGILLNETVVKQEALRLGLIKTTTAALTPQQRVLAVQAALYKQTADAQGDFARTSTGLANQQRILSAQVENLKARIGEALLPVVLQATAALTTQVMPALNELWSREGPKVIAWLTSATTKFSQFVGSVDLDKVADHVRRLGEQLSRVDWATLWAAITDAMKTVKEEGPGLNETLAVADTLITFLADHSDQLAKALPILAGAYVIFKVAQLGANVAMAASPALRVAEIIATRQQTKAIVANTAARATEAAATAVATNATVAGTTATRAATGATTLFGLSLKSALVPITVTVGVVAALAAGVIYLYRHSETFRATVQRAWSQVQTFGAEVREWVTPALRELASWVQGTVIPVVAKLFDQYIARGVAAFHQLQATVKDNETELATLAGWLRTVADFIITKVIPVVGPLFTGGLEGTITMIRVMIAQISFWVGAIRGMIDAAVAAKNAVVSAVNTMVATVTSARDRIVGVFSSIKSTFMDVGRSIVEGIGQGIENAMEWLLNKARDIGRKALDAAKKAIGFGSPAEKFIPLGASIGEGVVVGVDSTAPDVEESVRRLFPPPAPPAPPVSTGGRLDRVERLLEKLIDAVEGVAPGVGVEINGVGAALRVRGRTR